MESAPSKLKKKKTAIKISGELNEFREDASFLSIYLHENSDPIPSRYK